jgi:hypothetical protein
MNPNTIREMEPHIRQRFHFATSSFSRMFGVDKVTPEMIDFSYRWAETGMTTPLQGLDEVDVYFRRLWDTSRTGF